MPRCFSASFHSLRVGGLGCFPTLGNPLHGHGGCFFGTSKAKSEQLLFRMRGGSSAATESPPTPPVAALQTAQNPDQPSAATEKLSPEGPAAATGSPETAKPAACGHSTDAGCRRGQRSLLQTVAAPPPKAPIPQAAELRKAETLVREVLGEELSAARDPPQKSATCQPAD